MLLLKSLVQTQNKPLLVNDYLHYTVILILILHEQTEVREAKTFLTLLFALPR